MKSRNDSLDTAEWIGYDYSHSIQKCLEKCINELSIKNAKLMKEYNDAMIRYPLAHATRLKHLQHMYQVSKMIKKDWNDVLREDIDNVVTRIMETYSDEKGQESHTSNDFKKVLRIFYRWFKTGSRDKSVHEVDPYEVQGITFRPIKDKIARENLITQDDIMKLIEVCHSERNRALVSVHAEAGTRPGEILSLRIRDVVFDDIGAIISVVGKTTARPIRLITSVPYLLQYYNAHPHKNKPNSPLWIMTQSEYYGKPLTYQGASKLFERLAKLAGINKKVNLNIFRHSEATDSANYMTEAQLRKRHGWSPTSKMPARYTHLNDQDVENAIFEHHGIKKKEIRKQDTPIKCNFCDMFNPSNLDICSQCSKPLDLKMAVKLDEDKVKEIESKNAEIKNLNERMANLEKIILKSLAREKDKDKIDNFLEENRNESND